MSLIEKALNKLEKTDTRGTPRNSAPSGGLALREPPDEENMLRDPSWDYASPEPAPIPTTPAKTSQVVELNLRALQRMGYLTPETMHLPRADQYRRIKRPILVNAFGDAAKKIRNSNLVMVTSSVADEGKSYTSLNLAMSVAAEVDRTVLLVDADAFKQTTTKMLKLDQHPGLTDFLKTEGADLADYLLRTNVPNLAILPAGCFDHQVAELWASGKMHNFMDELARRYPDRLVIFDVAPVLAHAATLVLASMVGQVLLIVEAEKTAQHVVREALQALGDHVRVGLVLNKSNQREKMDYSYGYYSQ